MGKYYTRQGLLNVQAIRKALVYTITKKMQKGDFKTTIISH